MLVESDLIQAIVRSEYQIKEVLSNTLFLTV